MTLTLRPWGGGGGGPRQGQGQRLWGRGRRRLGCPPLCSSSVTVAAHPPVSWSCSPHLTRLLGYREQKLCIARSIWRVLILMLIQASSGLH